MTTTVCTEVRPATTEERVDLLDGSEGFIVTDKGRIVGKVGFFVLNGYSDSLGGEFYVHGLEVESDNKSIAAMLVQKTLATARERGYGSVICHCRMDSPFLAILKTSRAKVDSQMLRVEVNK
jgi:hypothetical protein